jgi:hypothetical protein
METSAIFLGADHPTFFYDGGVFIGEAQQTVLILGMPTLGTGIGDLCCVLSHFFEFPV